MQKSSPCYCVTLRRASQAITELYDAALAPSGLKITQLSLLRAVEREGPVSITALADAVYLDRTTLGRNLHVLEREGLVSLVPGFDLRERLVQLTDQGVATLEAAAPLWEQAQATVREALGKEQLKTLRDLLSQVGALTP
ncbi:MAG TPA: MarR family winged helix-turn-helix transcriptional regulator [Ktedonobacterales bacterium]|nr:MarR family winged helix-turn-helix transcriptional regulator [Ktedonobacterales bacterium]